ncbi:MAG: hypothetical protein V3U30_04120 [Thermoplasmata archaeon]
MKVVEFVDGELLVLEVASRSRPGTTTHFLSIIGETEVVCTCEAALYGKKCHHVESARDLIGMVTP